MFVGLVGLVIIVVVEVMYFFGYDAVCIYWVCFGEGVD